MTLDEFTAELDKPDRAGVSAVVQVKDQDELNEAANLVKGTAGDGKPPPKAVAIFRQQGTEEEAKEAAGKSEARLVTVPGRAAGR
eukprot:11015699-Alexandrium_andersonii.AAC.1